MQQMTDITCRTVVMKDSQYFVGVAMFEGGTMIYRFSPHVYDAKRFKSLEAAHRVAKRIGGCVKLFDALNGEMI